jgi:hypothetical protein
VPAWRETLRRGTSPKKLAGVYRGSLFWALVDLTVERNVTVPSGEPPSPSSRWLLKVRQEEGCPTVDITVEDRILAREADSAVSHPFRKE